MVCSRGGIYIGSFYFFVVSQEMAINYKPGKKSVGSKWPFRRKANEINKIEANAYPLEKSLYEGEIEKYLQLDLFNKKRHTHTKEVGLFRLNSALHHQDMAARLSLYRLSR